MTTRAAVLGFAALVAAVVSVTSWSASRSTDEGQRAAVVTADEGAQLFRAKGCASCHRGPGTSGGFEVAPPLTMASSWAGSRVPGTSAEEYLAESIRAPGAVRSPAATGSLQMPALGLTDAEVEAIVAYLLAG